MRNNQKSQRKTNNDLRKFFIGVSSGKMGPELLFFNIFFNFLAHFPTCSENHVPLYTLK